jgi:hypothetical protein
MKSENIKIDNIQISSITDENDITTQDINIASKHIVKKGYKILSNNFKKRCPGIFNNKTSFKIGNSKSIILKNNMLETIDKDIDKIIKDGDELFFFWPIPCKDEKYINFSMIIKEDDNQKKISLNNTNGKIIGNILNTFDPYDEKSMKDTYSKLELLGDLRHIISIKNNIISIEKNVIINSNELFILNILNQILSKQYNSKFNNYINLYTITSMLNYIGAVYSIYHKSDKKLYIYAAINESQDFKGNDLNITGSYKMTTGGLIYSSETQDNSFSLVFDSHLAEEINNGNVIAISTKDIYFQELLEDTDMWDFTTQRADATNYSLSFTPYMKNSDGDILAVIPNASKSADAFNPLKKEYFLNSNSGSVNSYIEHDAVLGLFNATSLKNI